MASMTRRKGESEGRVVIRYVIYGDRYARVLSFNRNERASDIYTMEVITKDFQGCGLFDARSASLGHTLQAFTISVGSYIWGAVRTDNAAVITLQSSAVKWVPVGEVLAHADMKNRRGKEAGGYKELVEKMVVRLQL